MEAAYTCTICHGDCKSSCRSSLVRYFSILENVSTRKRTSPETTTFSGFGLVDKVEGVLPVTLVPESLFERLAKTNTRYKRTRLRDRRWYLSIGEESCGFYLRLGYSNNPAIRNFVSRPSAFSTFDQYLNHLRLVFTNQELEQLEITRLDLSVDYATPLEDFLQCFDVKKKQTNMQFMDKGSHRTGVLLGKGSEKILVYDKRIEANLNMPKTRLEIQLRRNKLPTKKILELGKTLTTPAQRNGIAQVELLNITVLGSQYWLKDRDQERASELSVLLRQEGFLSARKKLNSNGNFERDYGHLFVKKPAVVQPSETFLESMKAFFNHREE